MNFLTKTRKAFTLVELLVVIAIIGVLIALLLPAVQAARESARRMQCTNHLKQLGIAMHNYHDTLQGLPPAGFGTSSSTTNVEYGNGLGWHVFILPFIEQEALYRKFRLAPGASMDDVAANPTTAADGTKKFVWSSVAVPGYFCPSGDDREAKIPSRLLTAIGKMPYTIHYAGIAGTHGYIEDGSTEIYEVKTIGTIKSNQEGNLPYQHGIDMSGIIDGTSNTLLIGEQTGGSCKKNTGDFTSGSDPHNKYKGCFGIDGWIRGNGLASSKNIVYGLNTFIPITGTGNHGTAPTSQAQVDDLYVSTPFNSHHPGGVNFVFGDGSVHFLSETISIYTLKKLGNRMDGYTVSY